ncbi:MAG: glutamate racemase, partial [Rhabdochlamydiaceae bacterium]
MRHVLRKLYVLPLSPVLGVISPTIREAIAESKNNRFGVIGMRRTIESNIYEKQLLQIQNNAIVINNACQQLVTLVEKGNNNNEIIRECLQPFIDAPVDVLILACTHFPFLRKAIQDILPNAFLVGGASAVARELKDRLEKD